MTTLQASAQKQLRQLVEQIERLEEEKKALAGDLRDKFLEAKAMGFDVKVLRQIVRLRKKSETERTEEDAILEVYMHALGMLADAPKEIDDRRGVTWTSIARPGGSEEGAPSEFGARPRRPRLEEGVNPTSPVRHSEERGIKIRTTARRE